VMSSDVLCSELIRKYDKTESNSSKTAADIKMIRMRLVLILSNLSVFSGFSGA